MSAWPAPQEHFVVQKLIPPVRLRATDFAPAPVKVGVKCKFGLFFKINKMGSAAPHLTFPVGGRDVLPAFEVKSDKVEARGR
jgi:hypothetical protein